MGLRTFTGLLAHSSTNQAKAPTLGVSLLYLALTLLLLVIEGLVIMVLWNFVAPAITRNAPRINFWQALALKFLIDFLIM